MYCIKLFVFFSKQPQVKDERDNSLKLAEFKLLLIAAAVKMLSDGSLNASVKLTDCTLDDKRETVQKASPRCSFFPKE